MANSNKKNNQGLNPLPDNGMRPQDFLDYTRMSAEEREIFAQDLAQRRDQMFPGEDRETTRTIAPPAIEPFHLTLLYTGSDAQHDLRQRAQESLGPEPNAATTRDDMMRSGARTYTIEKTPNGGKSVAVGNRGQARSAMAAKERHEQSHEEQADERPASIVAPDADPETDRNRGGHALYGEEHGLGARHKRKARRVASSSSEGSSCSSKSEQGQTEVEEKADSDGEWLPDAE